MAYTYRGKKITGTSKTAKKFKKSKVSNAKKGQKYLNTSTGHEYQCTTKGKPSDAKWKYVKTIIVKKPNIQLTSLSVPTRGSGHKMKSTWKVPKDLTKATNGRRAQSINITWTLDIPGKNDWKSLMSEDNEKATSAEVNLDSFTATNKKTYTRDSFHPRKYGNYLYGITCSVAPANSKGTGKAISKTTKFQIPQVPVISDPTFEPSNGVVSFTISKNDKGGVYERDDTKYRMVVYKSETDTTEVTYDTYTRGDSVTITHDEPSYQSIPYGHYIRVTVEAYSRGYAGNSVPVSKTFYYCYPNKATIEDVTVTGYDDNTDKTTAKVNVFINTNVEEEFPTDVVKLQYLADVPYKSAAEIPASVKPETSNIVDNGNCTALSIPAADIMPSKGNYTYVRVLSWHAAEEILFRYSNYWEVKQLFVSAPTAGDDDIDILSAVAGGDGESIVVTLAWNKDGLDDSTGTELTWSEAENTWRSTDDPDHHTFTWSDGRIYEHTKDETIVRDKEYYTRTGSGTDADPYVYTLVENPTVSDIDTYYEISYYDHAVITIKGLDEGTKYYIRARRYMESDDGTSYSDYSNMETCFTTETPDSIVASCPNYLPFGSSLPIRWTFSGNGLQSAWKIVKRVWDPQEEAYVDDAVIKKGDGSLGSMQIDCARLLELAEDNTITFNVQAATGSDFVVSDDMTLKIIDPPEITISASTPLRVQPLTFTATSTRVCDLKVIVSSLGMIGQYPEGVLSQSADDTIHSNIYSAVWNEGQDDTWTTSVELPTGLDFWDLGRYRLSVVAIDRQTGLQSTTQTFEFAIAWSHQAPSLLPRETYSLTADTEVAEDKPYFIYDSEAETYIDVLPEGDENPSSEGWYEVTTESYVTLTPIDTYNDDQMHHQAVQISLLPPPNAASTDVYDIYRLTGDGARLIGQNFPLTYVAQDEYAPFGDEMTLYYRVAIRTTDGDVEFIDVEYVQDCEFMRFDWATGTLELPYNISIGDKYSKDFETRQHMSGDIDGYWNSAVKRTASLSSDVIRLTQQNEIDATRALARYTGPVFVRTPDGSAYEADVQISDLSSEGRQIAAIAIDATEIGLTQEFMLPTPYVQEEAEEAENGMG